jgi:hypothetical protein
MVILNYILGNCRSECGAMADDDGSAACSKISKSSYIRMVCLSYKTQHNKGIPLTHLYCDTPMCNISIIPLSNNIFLNFTGQTSLIAIVPYVVTTPDI